MEMGAIISDPFRGVLDLSQHKNSGKGEINQCRGREMEKEIGFDFAMQEMHVETLEPVNRLINGIKGEKGTGCSRSQTSFQP